MAQPAETRKLAVITGGSAGIGEVFARRLSADHDLLLVARRADKMEKLAAELSGASGARVDVMSADLAEERGMTAVAERISREPNLALLINNAGYGKVGLFWESDLESEERMHRLHVMATIRLSHAALRNLVPRNTGAIINVASVAAFIRSAGSTSYSATKSWMTVFTEGLYLELEAAGSAVTVQALCPGFTYSEFHDTMGVNRLERAPASFWLSAEEVVDASLEGLRRKRLVVVPSLRYRVLTSLLAKMPTAMRLMVERGRKAPKHAR